MSVVSAVMVPHPPLLIPAVGRGQERAVADTAAAYRRAMAFLAASRPETVVVFSPHSILYSDYFHISPGTRASGSFAQFGAPETELRADYDDAFTAALAGRCREEGFPAGTLGERDAALDHGTMLPLYFLREACGGALPCRVVRIGLSGLGYAAHYRLGQLVRATAEALSRPVAVIGSGDLSHKMTPEGPYGFAPEGPEYDRRIMDTMGRAAFGELFDYPYSFCEKAAECGHRSFLLLAGCLDGVSVQAEALCHQGVTGVGYGVCTFLPGAPDEGRHFLRSYEAAAQARLDARQASEDPWVSLARQALEYFILTGAELPLPEELPEELTVRRAGVFVSLHKFGQLRGCIGTITPAEDCVAREIIRNAASAAARDPRFDPVEPSELEDLEYSVDVLGAPEDIASPAELDPKRYGVIVARGGRRGLLLPDLDGVDTAAEQIAIARRKAGIGPEEKVTLQRFEVVRHL